MNVENMITNVNTDANANPLSIQEATNDNSTVNPTNGNHLSDTNNNEDR